MTSEDRPAHGGTQVDPTMTILRSMPLAVILIDSSGRILFANPASRRLYALPADAEGQTLEDLVLTRGFFAHAGDGSDRVLSRLQVETSLKGSGRWSGWMRQVAGDGRTCSVEIDITRLGAGVSGDEQYVVVGRDITDSERIRHQRDQQRRLAQAVLHVSPTMTVVLDRQGRIIMGNSAWFRAATELGDVPLVGDNFHRLAISAARVVPGHNGLSLTGVIDQVLRSGESPVEVDVEVADASRVVRIFAVQVVRLIDELEDGPAIVLVMTDVTVRRSQERMLAHQANHDALTGLSNRTLLEEALVRALGRCERSGRRVALLYMDLDGFKPINDRLGHEAGDVVLRETAGRLIRACRLSDVVARVGGDEFVVVIEDVASPEDVLPLAERALLETRQPIRAGGEDVAINASIGIAVSPDGGPMPTYDALLRDGDTAMYVAKQAGGGQIAVFSPAMRTRTHPIGGEVILAAIAAGELSVAYQPVIAKDSTIMSVEALVRWSHPSLGLVGAEHLLATSGTTGALSELDAWMMSQTVAQIAAWEHLLPASAYLSVNVDDRWMGKPSWAEEILGLLEQQAVDPGRLGIEFDHSALSRDPAAVLRSLEQLSQAGVHLVLDDFGSARSSLGHLEAIPLACVKVDASLIARIDQRPTAQRLLDAIAAFCHAYAVPVVAKGVAQKRWLRQARDAQMDGFQGFYLLRPSPAEQLADWMSEVSRDPRLIPG